MTMKHWQILLLCLLATAAATGKTKQDGGNLPYITPWATTIDAEGLIELSSRQQQITIIDSRIAEDRQLGHISGSISLPDIETNCRSLAAVAEDKAQPLAFYCNGVMCGRSLKAVKVANTCGYSSLYWFRGGYTEWTRKNYPVETD